MDDRFHVIQFGQSSFSFTIRKQGDSDGRNRQKFVGIDRFRRISDEPIRRYLFVGKKKFVGISSELPTTFWRIPRNVILTNFRRYYDADTRDQSSSEKLYTDGERSSDYSDERSPRKIPTDYGSSEDTDGQWFVGIFWGILSVGIFRWTIVRRYISTPTIRWNISILKTN